MNKLLNFLALVVMLQSVSVSPVMANGQIAVFYVAAHPDDIQLFRGEQAYIDAQSPYVRSVWIIATAGGGNRTENWWKSREWGTIASMRAMFGWYPNIPSGCQVQYGTVIRNGHPILVYGFFDHGVERAVLYCLHLADGNKLGDGFDITHGQSLQKLEQSGMAIQAVDGSTWYTSWGDFTTTLKQIIDLEKSYAGGPDRPWITSNKYSKLDLTPGFKDNDHSDHLAVGDAVYSLTRPLPGQQSAYNTCWWVSYNNYLSGSPLVWSLQSVKSNVYHAYSIDMANSMSYFSSRGFPWLTASADSTEWYNDWATFGPYSLSAVR